MAIGFSHPLTSSSSPHQIQNQNQCCFCYLSRTTTNLSISKFVALPTLTRNPNSTAIRFRSIPRSSFRKSPNNSLKNSTEESKDSKLPIPQDVKLSNESSSNSVSSVFRPLRDVFRTDQLGLEILSIALPAALALAADPITSLVDTAFIGHLGSVELAAVGVSISVFNLVSKLFNVPLLNITTSFVAEEQALVVTDGDNNNLNRGSVPMLQDSMGNIQRKKLLPAVSTSLALAAGVGIAEAVALSIGSGSLMNIMGIAVDSPMRSPAEHFLALRAFGAPPIVIALAAQGTFRGFLDTKTPLYAIGAGNLLNAILDPILIFFCGLGVDGAAISTVISEYLIAIILLWKLNAEVVLIPANFEALGVARYLKSGGLLIGRTIAVLVTMTLATSVVAREGPISMAGYQICLEVWLALSLLTDALALAGQALLASSYSQGNYGRSRDVIYRALQIGLVTGVILATILFLGFEAFAGLFSTDSAVLEIASSGVLFVAGSQPVNAVAFVLDGLYYGVSDFAFAAYSMVLIGLISSLFLLVAVPMFGISGVWAGLFLFMSLRVVAGCWRLGTKGGPWKLVWSEMEQEN